MRVKRTDFLFDRTTLRRLLRKIIRGPGLTMVAIYSPVRRQKPEILNGDVISSKWMPFYWNQARGNHRCENSKTWPLAWTRRAHWGVYRLWSSYSKYFDLEIIHPQFFQKDHQHQTSICYVMKGSLLVFFNCLIPEVDECAGWWYHSGLSAGWSSGSSSGS